MPWSPLIATVLVATAGSAAIHAQADTKAQGNRVEMASMTQEVNWDQLDATGARAILDHRYDDAEMLYRHALDSLKGVPETDERLPEALHLECIALTVKRHLGDAQASCLQSLAIRARTVGEDNAATAEVMVSLATLSRLLGHYQDAERWAKRAVSINESSFRPVNSNCAAAYHELALDLMGQRRMPQAERMVRLALSSWGFEERSSAVFKSQEMTTLGVLYSRERRYRESIEWLGEALAAAEPLLGHEHPALIPPLTNLASVYLAMKSFQDAEGVGRRALGIAEVSLGGSSHDWAVAASIVGAASAGQGKLAMAESYYQRSLSVMARSNEVPGNEYALALREYARVLRKENKSADAELVEARWNAIRSSSGLTVSVGELGGAR